MAREGAPPGFVPGLVRAEYAWFMARVAGDAGEGRAWRHAAGGRGEEAAQIARAGIEAWEKHSMGETPSAWLRERWEELAAGAKRPG